MTSWLHILDDKPVIHRSDCAAMSDALETDAFSPALRDEIIAYGLAIRPAYEGLRSVLGQYAGLLLLAYGSPRADYPDLDVMTLAADRLREARDLLGQACPPAGISDHHGGLIEAAALLDKAHRSMTNGLRGVGQKEMTHRHLQAAQALLHKASDARFAMTMVDFGGCCCGAARP